jgi:hypothetical protein
MESGADESEEGLGDEADSDEDRSSEDESFEGSYLIWNSTVSREEEPRSQAAAMAAAFDSPRALGRAAEAAAAAQAQAPSAGADGGRSLADVLALHQRCSKPSARARDGLDDDDDRDHRHRRRRHRGPSVAAQFRSLHATLLDDEAASAAADALARAPSLPPCADAALSALPLGSLSLAALFATPRPLLLASAVRAAATTAAAAAAALPSARRKRALAAAGDTDALPATKRPAAPSLASVRRDAAAAARRNARAAKATLTAVRATVSALVSTVVRAARDAERAERRVKAQRSEREATTAWRAAVLRAPVPLRARQRKKRAGELAASGTAQGAASDLAATVQRPVVVERAAAVLDVRVRAPNPTAIPATAATTTAATAAAAAAGRRRAQWTPTPRRRRATRPTPPPLMPRHSCAPRSPPPRRRDARRRHLRLLSRRSARTSPAQQLPGSRPHGRASSRAPSRRSG